MKDKIEKEKKLKAYKLAYFSFVSQSKEFIVFLNIIDYSIIYIYIYIYI